MLFSENTYSVFVLMHLNIRRKVIFDVCSSIIVDQLFGQSVIHTKVVYFRLKECHKYYQEVLKYINNKLLPILIKLEILFT